MYHSMIIPSFAGTVSKHTYPGSLSVLGEGPVKEIFNLEEGFLIKDFLTFFPCRRKEQICEVALLPLWIVNDDANDADRLRVTERIAENFIFEEDQYFRCSDLMKESSLPFIKSIRFPIPFNSICWRAR